VKGFHLALRMGPAVARPVPAPIIEALTEVRVESNSGSQSGFQLLFTLGKDSPLQFALLEGLFDPAVRVIIVVTVNATPHVLMDGIITQQDLAPGNRAGESTLTVTGLDLTALMDFVDLTGVPLPPATPVFAIVAMLLSKFAPLGIVPKVVPSALEFINSPLERLPVQQGTDLQFIEKLAARVGHVFHLEPGPVPGKSMAYWGPEIRAGIPQPALSVDMDNATNVESLSFSYDGLAKVLPIVHVQPPRSRIPLPIPVPDITTLHPPLALKPAVRLRTQPLCDVAKHDPSEAVLLGLAQAVRTADAVTGSGELDVLRYGHVLRARQLVGVRGAGLAYDGLYYVRSVTHTIRRGSYGQSFSLARDGLISNTPRVPLGETPTSSALRGGPISIAERVLP
jgi:hypothetical protein